MLLISVLQPGLAPAADLESMPERLGRIARETRASLDTDPVALNLNSARADYLRQQLRRNRSPGRRLQLRLQLCEQLLRAGRTSEGIDELQALAESATAQRVSSDIVARIRDLRGLAHLRLAEEQNCVIHHTTASCLLPVLEEGVHRLPYGSRRAIEYYSQALEVNREDLASRWLLNIGYMTLGEYPDSVPPDLLIPPHVFDSEYEIGRFYDVAPQVGVDVIGLSGGSIMDDFDADGLLDIVASSWGLEDQIRYLHNQGDGTFDDRTEAAGLLGQVGGLNICHADYDNDGLLDILILRGAWLGSDGHHPNSLLRNTGGVFRDVTSEVGMLSFHPTHSAAWGDYDSDGWPDVFVGNESDIWERHPCELYRGDGDGSFSEVAEAEGIDHIGFVKGVAWGDYDNDGLLDLYVSALGESNVLYRNRGSSSDGHRFVDVSEQAGVSEPLGSLPTWFWDYDNDGWQDLFVGGYHNESVGDIPAGYLDLPSAATRSRLYRNRGDGCFEDVSARTGLDRPILAMGANFGDLDNDGWLDCYIGTGNPDLRSLIPNRMFRNDGGRYFQDVTTSGGFGHIQKGHGISFGDIDGDGDQDIHVVMGGAYGGDQYQNLLFENPGHGHHWITLRLEGVRSSRDAMGARIRLVTANALGEKRQIYATVTSGGSFGSSSLQQEIGLGDAEEIRVIEVKWLSGLVQTFEGITVDQVLRLREGDPVPTPEPTLSFQLNGSHNRGHRH